MYEALDEFLSTSTWHHLNFSDDERFFCNLRSIVSAPQFEASAMRRYMARKAECQLTDEAMEETLAHYEELADVVHRYLAANC
jgi:hypothetical protein